MKRSEPKAPQETLLPCPLCGSRAALETVMRSPWYRIRCDSYSCGCTTWAMQTTEAAIVAWNRRPTHGGP